MITKEGHETKHDVALSEMEDVQLQITQIWDSLLDLKLDVEKLQRGS